jgi:hypothetical protein
LQSAVIVLLKLLLATVTANNSLANLPSVTDGAVRVYARPRSADTARTEEPAPPVLNLEDTDIMRHREITSKAVSAIVILTLKWFKTSRAPAPLACRLRYEQYVQMS